MIYRQPTGVIVDVPVVPGVDGGAHVPARADKVLVGRLHLRRGRWPLSERAAALHPHLESMVPVIATSRYGEP